MRRLNPPHCSHLAAQRIDESGPGSILMDFEMLLGFIEEGVRSTGKYHLLPMARLFELDQRMTNPLGPRLKRPQQKLFPHINGLYLLLRATQLGVPKGQGKTSGQLTLDALIAFYSDDDAQHAACKEQMSLLPLGKAYTCWPVIVEAAYMLRRRPEQRDDLLESVGNGYLPLLRLRSNDVAQVRAILTKYHDQDIDLADACLLHLADRENIGSVLTLDRRHFGILRRGNGEMLKILPERG